MVLTDAQVERWRADGFVPVPDFFDGRVVRTLQAGVECPS